VSSGQWKTSAGRTKLCTVFGERRMRRINGSRRRLSRESVVGCIFGWLETENRNGAHMETENQP
jgi:hypothetical protein